MRPFTPFYASILIASILLMTVSAAANDIPDGDIEITGHFQVVVFCDFDNNQSHDEYWLTTDDNKHYVLDLSNMDEIPEAGSTITIKGHSVSKLFIVEEMEVQESPLGNDVIGEQSICVLLINFQDDTRENVTVETARSMFFNNNDSASVYWQQASFGKTWATGDVFGWYTLPTSRNCDPGLWRQLAIEAADPDVYFPDYNRLFLLMPEAGGCGWGGLGTLGVDQFQTDDGPFVASTSWCRSEYYNDRPTAIMITTHEGGHNLGQHHARSIEWAGEALGPFDCNACGGSVLEYGDRFDTLGSWNLGMYNARHKEFLGWHNEGNVKMVLQSGRFRIEPFETDTTGRKVLKIFRGRGDTTNRDEWIYIEWRQPIGYDADINYNFGINYNGVFFHYDWSDGGTPTYLLDMTPGDGDLLNPVLLAGRTWTDQYTGLKVNPVGINNDKMVIDITMPLDFSEVVVTRGVLLNGNAEDLIRSDNSYLHTRSGFGETLIELHSMELDILAVSNTNASSTIDLKIESRINQPSGTAQILMKNFNTGDYDLVGSYSIGTSEIARYIPDLDAGKYLNSNNGRMRLIIKHLVFVPFLAFTFESFIDQVKITVE